MTPEPAPIRTLADAIAAGELALRHTPPGAVATILPRALGLLLEAARAAGERPE